MKLHDEIAAHQEDLAVLITRENGKPLAEARGEVAYSNSYFAWFAEEAKRVNGDVLPPRNSKERAMVTLLWSMCSSFFTPWPVLSLSGGSLGLVDRPALP